jgi:hypothetical protein
MDDEKLPFDQCAGEIRVSAAYNHTQNQSKCAGIWLMDDEKLPFDQCAGEIRVSADHHWRQSERLSLPGKRRRRLMNESPTNRSINPQAFRLMDHGVA